MSRRGAAAGEERHARRAVAALLAAVWLAQERPGLGAGAGEAPWIDRLAPAQLDVDGSATLRHTGEFGRDDSDQDLYEYYRLRLAETRWRRLRVESSGRLAQDLDGESGFYDGYDGENEDRLYTLTAAWADQQRVELKAGRQYSEGLEIAHFDGVRGRLLDLWGAEADLFGGAYVSYDSDTSDNEVYGGRLALSPWAGATLEGELLQITDFPSGDDDYVTVAAHQRLGRTGYGYGQLGWLNGGLKDLNARLRGELAPLGLQLQGRYYRLFQALEALSNRFDPYYPLLGDYAEFHQYGLDATRYFGEQVYLTVGATRRDLVDDQEESKANREFDRAYVNLGTEDLGWEGLACLVDLSLWDSGDGEKTRSAGFEVSQLLSRRLKLGAGTSYALYKYDFERDLEQTDVRTIFADLKWTLAAGTTLRLAYQYEEDESEAAPYHTVDSRLTVQF